MNLVVDADRVLADLNELHERHGGPDGARRFVYAATSPQMAGIVISNFFTNRFGDL